jgi:hypothetical protein
VDTGASRPAGVSIGRYLRFDRSALQNADFTDAISAIDRVHGIAGQLLDVPLLNAGAVVDPDRRGADAWFRFEIEPDLSVRPLSIVVRLATPHRRLKTQHEIGHYIDLEGLPGDGFSSSVAVELADWRAAIRRSDAFQELARLTRTASDAGQRRMRAALALDEVWARSYAQFIALRSGDPRLLAEVGALRTGAIGDVAIPLQWASDDFAPISAAITALMRRLRWMS